MPTRAEQIRRRRINCPDEPVKLTKRELEVLLLVSEGRSSGEVADMLFVSRRTIGFHLTNIYERLQVSNRTKAFHEAARLGLIPESWRRGEQE